MRSINASKTIGYRVRAEPTIKLFSTGYFSLKAAKGLKDVGIRTEEYKRLEDNQLQSEGKASLLNCSQQGIFLSRPQKDLRM